MSSRNLFMRTGILVGAGIDKKVILGYKPSHVIVHNVTDRISAEKFESMEGDKALNRDVAGTGTYVDLITLNADGFTILAALAVDTKELHFMALESNIAKD